MIPSLLENLSFPSSSKLIWGGQVNKCVYEEDSIAKPCKSYQPWNKKNFKKKANCGHGGKELGGKAFKFEEAFL